MRPFRCILLLLAVLTLPALVRAQSRTPGFQLEADGMLYSPHGTLAAAGNAELSSLLAAGPGVALTASLGLTRHWVLGARVAYFGSEKDGSFRFVDEFNTNGQPFADGSGPYDLNRQLRATAVHGLLQYRHALGARFEALLEVGGGVVSARERLLLRSATGEQASAVGVQLDPSWTVGAGLAVPVGWNTDVTSSARWAGTFSDDGAVWSQTDAPGYLHWALGVRYPHDTH